MALTGLTQVEAQNLLVVILNGPTTAGFLREQNLEIPGLEINGHLDIRRDPYASIKSLTFRGCNFKNEVTFSKYSNLQTISFENCEFEEKVQFHDLPIYVEFRNFCVIKAPIDFFLTKAPSLRIHESTIESTISITGSVSEEIRIRRINIDRVFRGHFLFRELKAKQILGRDTYCTSLEISGRTAVENCDINNVFGENFSVHDAEIAEIVQLNRCKIYNLSFEGIRNTKKLKINDCTIAESANFILEGLNNTLIENCRLIRELTIQGRSEKESVFSVENVSVDSLKFDKIWNDGFLLLKNVSVWKGGSLSMISSVFGKTDFILCSFSEATLEFENSKMTDCFFSETDFPKSIKIGSKVNHAQAQLVFGQLHTAFQKQGDTVRALEYQAREIEAHYKKLKWFISWKKPFINFTWLNLALNKLSNNFGRSWFKAVLLSFAIGVIFFYAVVINTDEYYIDFAISINENLLKAFFKFMNPLRFLETDTLFKQPLTLSTPSYIFDFAGRIFVAYMYYQTIQAFRRFGRK